MQLSQNGSPRTSRVKVCVPIRGVRNIHFSDNLAFYFLVTIFLTFTLLPYYRQRQLILCRKDCYQQQLNLSNYFQRLVKKIRNY